MREDWIEIELGDIAYIYNGNSINARIKKEKYETCKKGLNYIGTKDVGFDTIINYQNGVKIPFNEPKFKTAPKGAVLVCSEGGSAGRKVGFTDEEVCFGNKLFAITNEYSAFEGKYVFYYTRYRGFFQAFQNQMNGIIGGVSAKKFSTIPIPLAPLPIQRAIVSKIESLFSDLDNGIANLKKAQEQLKIYRQAVLKKAFEGELTKKWREEIVQTHGRASRRADLLPTAEELLQQIKEERQNHYKQQIEDWKKAVKEWEVVKTHGRASQSKKPTKPKAIKELPPLTEDELKALPELPDSWKYIKTSDVIDVINNGYTPKSNFLTQDSGEIPFLKVYKLNFDGTLNDKKNPTFIPKDIHKKDLLRSICYPNDVLTNIVGPPLGKVSIVSKKHPEWNINQAIVLFRPNAFISSKYISFFLQYPLTVNWLEGTSKATAGQYNIKVSTCRETPMQYCSLVEQHQIVQEIESRLSVCDKMEQSISESLEKANALRQSILKKAFEGKLLNEEEIKACKQEADYEPASVLLQRIKNEKLRITKESKQNPQKKIVKTKNRNS